MPKVNIYLPNDLADRVREARLPTSRICQTALSNALEGAAAYDIAPHDELEVLRADFDTAIPLGVHVARFLRMSYDLAAARNSATVESRDVLQAVLDEGESLALHTIERCGVSRRALQQSLDAEVAATATTPVPPGSPTPSTPSASAGGSPTMSEAMRAIIAEATTLAQSRSLPVLNGGHFLLALIRDPGVAGSVLRAKGVDEILTRTVVDALAEATQYRAALANSEVAAWMVSALTSIMARLDRIDDRL